MNGIDIVDLIYDYVVEGMPTRKYNGTYDNTITSKYRKYMPGKSDATVARELLKELRSYGIKTNVISGTDGRGKDCGLYQGGYARPMKLSKADIRDYVNKQTRGKVEDLTDYYNKYISKTIGKNEYVRDDEDLDNTQQKFNSALNHRNNTFGFGGFDNESDFSNTGYTDDDEALPPEVIRRAIIRAAIIIAVIIAAIKIIW